MKNNDKTNGKAMKLTEPLIENIIVISDQIKRLKTDIIKASTKLEDEKEKVLFYAMVGISMMGMNRSMEEIGEFVSEEIELIKDKLSTVSVDKSMNNS